MSALVPAGSDGGGGCWCYLLSLTVLPSHCTGVLAGREENCSCARVSQNWRFLKRVSGSTASTAAAARVDDGVLLMAGTQNVCCKVYNCWWDGEQHLLGKSWHLDTHWFQSWHSSCNQLLPRHCPPREPKLHQKKAGKMLIPHDSSLVGTSCRVPVREDSLGIQAVRAQPSLCKSREFLWR